MNTLEYAINMELDSIIYYTEQARININNSLLTVCLILANDEINHARILRDKLSKMPYEFKDNETLAKVKNVFKGIGNYKSEIKAIPSQLDFYRMALEKEKQSIDLYTGFLSKATDDQEKDLFKYLIKQEEDHYALLDELVTLLLHAEEWVEFAEFGVRKDY